MARKWQHIEVYRGYAIELSDRKRRPYRVEVPGRDPNRPGGHADMDSVGECKQFVDRALERLED